jgi:hypothetical protein
MLQKWEEKEEQQSDAARESIFLLALLHAM